MVIRSCAVVAAMLLSGTAITAQAMPSACAGRLFSQSERAGSPVADLSARDLIELRDFGDFSVSPDGKFAALILRRASIATDDYCIGLVVIPLSLGGVPRLLDVGGEPLPARADLSGVADIPNGGIAGTAPAWSPDGRSIAYLRRDRGVTQIWIARLDGTVRQLTHLADDARSVAWASPTTIAASVRPTGNEEAAISAEGRSGYLYDRRFWAISENRPNPAPIPVKTMAFDVASGRSSKLPIDRPDPDKPAKTQIFVRLVGGGRAWTQPQSPQLYGSPVALHVEFGGRSLECGEACSSRVIAIWARGSELIFLRSGSPDNGGRTQLLSWELNGRGPPRLILETDDGLSGCRLAANRIICGLETAVHPRALAAIDPSTGAMTALYDPNPGFSGLIRNRVQRLRWTAADGIASYGDLVLPPDYRAGQRLPLIIVQYFSHGFLRGGVGDEYPIHLFAARGYAVLSVTRPESASDGSGSSPRMRRSSASPRRPRRGTPHPQLRSPRRRRCSSACCPGQRHGRFRRPYRSRPHSPRGSPRPRPRSHCR